MQYNYDSNFDFGWKIALTSNFMFLCGAEQSAPKGNLKKRKFVF